MAIKHAKRTRKGRGFDQRLRTLLKEALQSWPVLSAPFPLATKTPDTPPTMNTLPEDIASSIRARFHESHHNTLELDMDSKGRPGFWNFDRSHFIPCAESFEAFRAEMRNPSPHCAEDAQGLGLLSD